LERTGVDDLAVLVDSVELDPALLATISGAWVLTARGRLRVAHGHRSEGVADLRAAGEIFERARFGNPIAALWRSPLALALPADARDEARDLVAEELGEARARGLARCEGGALRAAGILEGGPAGIELLAKSLGTLEAVDAPLERARTLVELGAAHRRGNRRVASREPLTAGLELAYLCGAEQLASRAIDELRASGARPRRAMTSGPDALTSAEARVARMAGEGMSNKDIAQALFVTTKTVENQLNAVYRKLRVRSRAELGRTLRAVSPD
jgi:DNA-binding CsgD family transcriptional regulator